MSVNPSNNSNSNTFSNKVLEISLKIVDRSQDNLDRQTSAYIEIAEAYQKLNQSKNAASVVKAFLELNQKYQSNNYSSLEEIAKFYSKQGNKIEAIRFLNLALSSAKKIPDSDYEERDNVIVRLGDKFVELGEFAKGFECAELIEDDFDKYQLYQCMAYEAIDNCQYEVDLVIDKTKETGFENFLLEEVVDSYLDCGDFQRASEAIEMMNQEQAKVNALANFARKYCELGNEVEAVESLNRAMKIADRIQNSSATAWSLQVISDVAQKLDNSVKYDSLLSDSVEKAKSIDDPFLQGFAFNNLAFQLASAGKYEEAIETIESSNPFIPKFQKIRLLIQVAKQYRRTDKLEQAKRIIDLAIESIAEVKGNELAIPDEHAQSFAWNEIADYALEYDRLDLAWEIIDRIEPASARVILLIKISEKYITNVRYEEAHKTLTNAEQILWKIQNQNDLYLATSIIHQYLEMKDYCSAIEVVNKITSDLQQAEALIAIALRYSKSPQKISKETWEILETL